jgi:hypothetical protein
LEGSCSDGELRFGDFENPTRRSKDTGLCFEHSLTGLKAATFKGARISEAGEFLSEHTEVKPGRKAQTETLPRIGLAR